MRSLLGGDAYCVREHARGKRGPRAAQGVREGPVAQRRDALRRAADGGARRYIQVFTSIKENLVVFFSNKQTNKQTCRLNNTRIGQ